MGPFELLAHQGGWDEILMVAGPIAVFGLLLLVARRRALAEAGKRTTAADEPT
jgi:hypothetical protein